MGRSRFPGKPLKFQNRKRISVLSGTVYHETSAHSNSDGASANVFTGNKEEEEKKENNNDPVNETSDIKLSETSPEIEDTDKTKNPSKSTSPVRTRSQNKMDPTKPEKPKPVKKTVTFGTVESCEDFLPLKKLPKNHPPLVSIIKKKSALKQTEYSSFSSILKPAKLTDLSSKSSLEYHEGYMRKNLNPLSKPMNKFSQFSESRCTSPPPRSSSPEKEGSSGGNRFILPARSSHSSRVIKPNKRFMDADDSTTSGINTGKVLKKPKLKQVVFNNLLGDEDTPEDETTEKNVAEPVKESTTACNLFKDKTSNSFSSLNENNRKKDVFAYEKEDEYSQDENSNLEGLEKGKLVESQKEDRGGHALRKLVDISDASSTSSTSSGSDSEQSWDSDETGIGDDEDRPSLPSPERDKAPASQLLSGKVIIREARLQLNSPAQSSLGPDGPFSTFSGSNSPVPPTTVTCGVCGAVRFYKFVKQARKFGIYSCESCRKFISKMLKKAKLSLNTPPVVMQCLKGEGNCHVPPIVRSQQWKLTRCENKARCPACWLKMCLKAFQVPPSIRTGLYAMLPSSMKGNTISTGPLTQVNPLRIGGSNTLPAPPPQPTFSTLTTNNDTENKVFTSLKTKKSIEENDEKEDNNIEHDDVQSENDELNTNKKRRQTKVKVRKKDKSSSKNDKQSEDPKRQKVEMKGPRVKHVCRSASIVLGQPIATFPTPEEKAKDSAVSSDDDVPMLSIEKDKSESKSCETDREIELENKAPQVVPENPIPKDIISTEAKKRKVDTIVLPKVPNKGELSEDETTMELVPRKTTIKPFTNITNVRGRAQKCGQNRPELISIDFWESYDPDEVCTSGFGLIGTTPFTVPRLCFLCGSAGQEKMLVCLRCCEWYHSWCAEEASSSAAGWVCGRCVWCAACGKAAATRRCRGCAKHYHAACLPKAPADHRTDWPQICSACLKCKSCDSIKVSKFVGSLPFCSSCFKLRQKGNYCPICQACYRDNDFDSKMMECGWCARWVHASCEELSGEGYQLLSALPPAVEYICRQCMPHDPPWRQMLTDHLKSRLLHLLKLLAKNKKACSLLKLTPHKNTPISNKPYRIMSPQAIRKLHFESSDESMKNTSETKVYRNLSRGRKSNPLSTQKMDTANADNSENPWHRSLITEMSMDQDGIPHPSHKVVNLQEPLMQNKEVCFSTGMYGAKSDFDIPCIEVHENDPIKMESRNELLPTTIHDDKYDAISDDDEPTRHDSVCSEQDLSPAIVRPPPPDINESKIITSPTLLDVKKRVNSDEYISLKDFNHEMTEVIERTLNGDLKSIYRELFSETFPWFDCVNNCLKPNLEIEGEHDSESKKDHEMKDKSLNISKRSSIDRPLDQIVPKLECEGDKLEELLETYPLVDARNCILCKSVGDGFPAMEGRLLYCGQSDWIHANCALWSAEVFEEIDGSLQNVHSAISRGKMIKCAVCELKGASVGCCAKNCGETYHYSCARKEYCAFMDDKRVFCPNHGKDIPLKSLQRDAEFELTRPVYVELDKKKKRYSEVTKVQFLLGSLTVQNLGKIVPSVSDYEDYLMPVDFMCTRLFWSCKKPLKVVRYTIKTKLLLSEPLPGFDYGVNITVDHSQSVQVVERVMAEIGAWHQTIENGGAPTALFLKKDKSPIKLRNGVTLEDIAVKQVVDGLLDSVCKMEQQDEEEPQSTADLLPPELKDAIFEDLNHDLLDGISMQDIFPKLMSYEDLAVMDLKNEFYGAISQSDDKIDKSDRSTTDFIDELLKSSSRHESGSKELKRSKSEMLLQNHNFKSLATGRGQQRSSSLTWSNKFDSTLLSSTIKRCKINRTSTITGKLSPVQRTSLTDSLEAIKEENANVSNAEKRKRESTSTICDEAPHTSGLTYHTTSSKEKELETETGTEKSDKNEGYYDVIDFYTKIQCSPISQLDGACDWSGSESTCSSRPNSPQDTFDFTPISQLDGADENMPGDNSRNQTNQFMYRASGTESTYTVTLAGTSINGQPELMMRTLDDGMGPSHGHIEQLVRCDRCHCTYRNKESYDRHVPTCDLMSTSESESENPKSPESRTLATLQNAFQSAFAQPMILHAGMVSGSESTVKAEGISARRTSINTRQITINGTIVETPSPGPSNEMTMTITEQMKSGTMIFDQGKTTNMQVSASQQMLSSPQIVVTPQMLLPPKTPNSNQKMMAPQIITQNGGLLPYNICVKPSSGNGNLQHIQSGTDMTQILSSAGGIQVLSSNSNQVLTIPSNQQGLLQGQKQVASFPNMASATSITLPVNSMQNTSLIQNIQPMIRPQLQGNPTIVVPTMTQRLSSPNAHNKQHIILPGTPQKSPKKHLQPVQPKPILQAINRNRGRPIPKPTTIKRQTKLEKTYTTINQSHIGPGNTVIQLQTNNQTGQPSLIVQPVGNQNIMSYVEALSQQQNQNMQYISIAPQNDIMKTAPTQFISTQGGLMPQTFQIQQTENGGLVAVPSGGIPVLLQQGNVGILPQSLQQGATILPQGAIQTQGIIQQGPNGHTILPQTIHTQNGTIIPQGTLQGISPGTITSQTATLLPNNTLQSGGATVVPHSGINNNQTTIIPNSALQTQGNTLISSAQGATLLPQGALLPQFCNDQVILGSTPTLEMVTDQSGCMYLTATQPLYYGLETIVQNTVMSSQQFVSTAMQGVLAQNSSFSATTTQVFQASKIEPIVEVPTGYVVVNNVGDGQVSSANMGGQTVQTSPQGIKVKTSAPNITLQPLPDKSNRQGHKVIQMSPASIIGSQPGTVNIITGRPNYAPITSQIHSMSLSNAPHNISKGTIHKHTVSMQPNVTLVSSTGQPVMAISQSIPHSVSSLSMQSMPMPQPIITTSIASQMGKVMAPKMENSHVIEISGNLQDNNSSNMPTISVTQSLKSPTPWRQINSSASCGNDINKTIEIQNVSLKGNNMCTNSSLNIQTSSMKMNQIHHNDQDKLNQNCLMTMSNNCNPGGMNIQSHQFESSLNVSHHSNHMPTNNVIQITAGSIYPPSSNISTFDAETTLKLNKINALSKTEGGHMNFSQEIMASHSQHNAQNDKSFQNLPTTENKHNMDGVNNQMNVHKLSSCQLSGSNNNNQPSISIIPHNIMRSSVSNAQSSGTTQNHQSQMISMTSNGHSLQMLSSNTMSNISCQETSNNRMTTEQQSSPQHDMTTNMSQNNLQMMGHESGHHHTTPNQIHIMNGQIQHNRPQENTQIQQSNMMSQGQSNRFHDAIMGGQHNQSNIIPNRNSADNISLMNQTMMHNMPTNHNNRQQNDMSHMHMQQPMGNVNNMQNNRMLIDNMNNINHQMHSNRPMDNMHNQMSHNVQQINHHMNNSNRQSMDNNLHLNTQMGMQQNRQLDSVNHNHHQHSIPNVMQLQNNRSHVDNNMMSMHSHIPNQMHNRQLDNNIHMHHIPNNVQNQCMNSQMDNANSMNQNMSNTIHNRHDNMNSMQNMTVLNQMQNNNRSTMDHNNIMQHQMNNINMHNSHNTNMQLNNSGQGMNTSMLHNIPDIKNEMSASCSGSCPNNNTQFTSNQSYEMCSGSNLNVNSNMNAGNMMHNMNVNNSNINNMMMNNVNNSVFGGNNISNIGTHDIMLGGCNNSSEHSGSGMITSTSNHMMMNNSHSHTNNQNQILNNQVPNNQQININNMNTNNTTQNLTNLDNQLNRPNMGVNEPAKFPQEQMRGKNMIGQQTVNQNMSSMQSHPNNDCAKVNNPVGYMQVNAPNNRVINMPERSRINNQNISNLDNNINQHNIPQHNIRVVTNNNNNGSGISTEPLTFTHKTEANSTMINVPFQAIPNSAPMNINVNSSNNTVNITVQNNLVDPKIASKAAADLNFPIQTSSNLIPNQNTSSNMICIPVANNSTINLPTQNSTSITLPVAPPTQQSGIPTNVVTPMSTRPMNRVLPLHRDGPSKAGLPTAPRTSPTPKPQAQPVSQDMPDLNMKDENIDSDLEKAIEESKRMMELERVKKEKEEIESARAVEMSQIDQGSSSSEISNSQPEDANMEPAPKPHSLPSLEAQIEIDRPKVLIEKSLNRVQGPARLPTKVMKRPFEKKSDEVVTKKTSKTLRGQENRNAGAALRPNPDPPKDDGPKLIYEVTSEDGFNYSSTSLTDLWAKVVEAVQNARKLTGLQPIQYNLQNSQAGAHLLGLNNNALRYLLEQLPGANRCTKYKTRQGRDLSGWDNDLDLSEGFKESTWGSARAGPVIKKHSHDMFSWKASPFREEPPPLGTQDGESLVSRRLATLPMAMRFRHLKETSKASVGVYRSHIHGRGLFCKRDIEEGDMVIEYAGEVIRAVLADQREKWYEAMRGRRGVAGCYMFRIDDHLVVDATLKGNAARFINHSCDPNCYSRVVDIHGHKHILIFALRRITIGEELTYDYKFPFEEVKIPCTCGAKKCRKYLN